jgi:hypothetical protein
MRKRQSQHAAMRHAAVDALMCAADFAKGATNMSYGLLSNFSPHDLDNVEVFSGSSFHHGDVALSMGI